MNVQSQFKPDYALINFFSGRATRDEEKLVQNWISQNPENTSYYYKIQRLWFQRIVL
ncbi:MULTISPECIES: hypothetical protein [Aquimarina]|uniref:hypothetical protein n=1 Tax=Aquimarina TaxID=290174 RepID=UPI000B2E99EB|nr:MULTISPECIES: hypothetical protein [Aquimarina]